MAHYQFETLHPFQDGNGRIGRLLIVLLLFSTGVLSEPTLTVSPWFEARRDDYYDSLFGVSSTNAWDPYVRFFSNALRGSAERTRAQMLDLVAVQASLHERVRTSRLRADSAHALVDLAVGRATFGVRVVEAELTLSYGRANSLIGDLVGLEILAPTRTRSYNRRFYAPDVHRVLLAA